MIKRLKDAWLSSEFLIEDHPKAARAVILGLVVAMLLLAIVEPAKADHGISGYPVVVDVTPEQLVLGMPCPTKEKEDLLWVVFSNTDQALVEKESGALYNMVSTFPHTTKEMEHRIAVFLKAMNELGWSAEAGSYITTCWLMDGNPS